MHFLWSKYWLKYSLGDPSFVGKEGMGHYKTYVYVKSICVSKDFLHRAEPPYNMVYNNKILMA